VYENAERWDKDVPPDLIPAIKHLRHSFDRAQWAFGWTTQKLCWSCFHGNLDEEDVKSHIKTLGRLKQEAGPVPTQRLAELLEVGTPSAVFKAFFNFYLEGVSKQALNIFKELAEIGLANEPRLPLSHIEWATTQTRHLIRSNKHNIENWIKEACDKKVVHYWRLWKAPLFLITKPLRDQPYEAARAWERKDAKTSNELLNWFEDLYVVFLDGKLEQAAGEAAVELAKENKPNQADSINAIRNGSTKASEARQENVGAETAIELPTQSRQIQLIGNGHNESTKLLMAPQMDEGINPTFDRRMKLLNRVQKAKPGETVTTEEAAILLGIEKRSVQRRVSKGLLTASEKRGRITIDSVKRRLPKSEMDAESTSSN